MIKREISNYLDELSSQYPVITITGPRQSGKTTLVRNFFKNKPYINLEHPETRTIAENDPVGFLKKYPEGAILDEVQKVPDLLSYIQVIVDEKKVMGMFILTGSSQFNLIKSITQSLAGRTALLKLLPFSVSELTPYIEKHDNYEFMYKGFYPVIYDRKLNPSRAYGDYFETYVERDLHQLSQIHNLSMFQNFVAMCAGRVGQLLNLSNLANDVGITHTTAKEWLTILEASYLVFLLKPYYSNIKKRLIKSPKIYFYDVGLVSYLIGIENKNQLVTHPLIGNLFENMVVMELLKYRYNSGRRNNLNFYRDSNGNEVDIFYNIAQHVLPIEIKAGATVTKDYFKGFKYLNKILPDFPYSKAIIYGGDRYDKVGNTQILGLNKIIDFIKNII